MSQASEQKVISFRAMRRSRTTIEDFVKSYFPLHELHIPEALFAHLDTLVFVEALIYQMDEENEELCGRGLVAEGHDFQGLEVLRGVLRQQGLLTEAVEGELRQGQEYWRLERLICTAMLTAGKGAPAGPDGAPAAGVGGGSGNSGSGSRADNEAATTGCAPFTEGQVMAAHEAKSFDYRVLHLLLHHLSGLGPSPSPALLAFLRADELLVDIGDDLTDYEDDVAGNSFNVYRAFIHLHGSRAQEKLVERIVWLEAQRARLLAGLPQEVQRVARARQREAADGQGSDKWIFPAPIPAADEAEWRADVQRAEAPAPTGGS